MVLDVLAWHANAHELAWPGLATLAREAGMSERSVRRATRELVERGYIEVARRGGGRYGDTKRYRLRIKNRPPLATSEQATTGRVSHPEMRPAEVEMRPAEVEMGPLLPPERQERHERTARAALALIADKAVADRELAGHPVKNPTSYRRRVMANHAVAVAELVDADPGAPAETIAARRLAAVPPSARFGPCPVCGASDAKPGAHCSARGDACPMGGRCGRRRT
jgi:hypothetical protein